MATPPTPQQLIQAEKNLIFKLYLIAMRYKNPVFLAQIGAGILGAINRIRSIETKHNLPSTV